MTLNETLEDKLIPLYTKRFYDDNKSEEEKFSILSSSVCLHTLSNLYTRFMKDSGIQTIDDIGEEKKSKYLRLAQAHYKSRSDINKAMKCAYVLELITSTF